jgi:hypothetical protein
MLIARILLSAWACLAASSLAAGAVSFPADPVCDDRAKLVGTLQETYGEQHRAVGLEEDTEQLLEIWVSPDTGTWTILMTQPNGISCLAAAGSDWMHTGEVEGVRAPVRLRPHPPDR